MPKKSAKNPTPAFWTGLDLPGSASLKPRPLPPTTQSLFLPKLVHEAARGKYLTDYADKREAAYLAFRKWIDDLRAGVIQSQNETQVEGDFASKLLRSLGYATLGDVPTGQPWSMTPKWQIPGNGEVDVALGSFHRDADGRPVERPTVMVELKGAGTDLDRRGSRNRSAVQQAWDYLIACEGGRWAIVSNYVEIRLYSRDKTANHVYRVIVDDLEDPDRFAEFFALFHADGLLERVPLPHNARTLLEETGRKQETVTDELYESYTEQRAALIEDIRAVRPELTQDDAISAAQNLLNRILFVAFAEDRQLIPDRQTLEHTAGSRRPGSTRWRAFQDLFAALDQGDEFAGIPAFNGDLFKPDPLLDDPRFRLDDDRWPVFFKSIGDYDFRDEVPVDILGRIFERSITDIEEIRARGLDAHRAELAERRARAKDPKGRRRREGVYYTDDAITGYLVAAALDPAWEANRAELMARHGLEDDHPSAEEPDPKLAAYVRDRLGWLDGLAVCDPACGSGAFLIAAYNWFEDRRLALLDDLKLVEPDAPEADGDRLDWLRRSAPQILAHNLYGVDLSPESVQIARLSLWIRTAQRGERLTNLAGNILCGNSVADDPAVAGDRAFRWAEQFPVVFARGGFDAVVGNPPYVRQEWLGKPLKDHLAGRFRAYHGMADLYVYFYERGLDVLRPGGRLAFVVTNKWMKAGYGEPLRRLFAEGAWVESVVDFGHAKKFFADADVFPCFLVARKPADEPPPEAARVCAIPRDLAALDGLADLVAGHALSVERDRFGPDPWNLEPKAVGDLMAKIRERGVPLVEYAGLKPYRGIITGLNDAFRIDTATKDALVKADPKVGPLIRPYLRGQDIARWQPEWAGLWMIALKSSGDHPWPWADLADGAEAAFASEYPSLYKHLLPYKEALIKRQDQGRHWWELRACAYWDEFDKPKIVYQEIQYHPSYCLDISSRLTNNKAFLLAKPDLFLLSVLNSPLLWWSNWRYLPHMKDEALTPVAFLMEQLPIARPSDDVRQVAEVIVEQLTSVHGAGGEMRGQVLDWLKVEYDLAKPTQKLSNPIGLDTDAFVAEVKKSLGKRKPLTAAAVADLRREHAETIEPARERAREAEGLEVRLNELVNAAYGLTPEEVRLLWQTAPPRMPIPDPFGAD